jgi:hypothetical protein
MRFIWSSGMAVDVGIWLFNLRQCGYYKSLVPRAGTPPVLSSAAGAFNDLRRWSNGRRLTETSTYAVGEGDELPLSYLLACEPSANGDYLIGVWNRVNGDSNRIASIGHNDIVGQARTEYTDVEEGRIPGYATYFWVMPAEGKVASVRVKHSMNGVRVLEHYVRNFLKYINPQHAVVRDDGDDGLAVIGYREHPGAEKVHDLNAKFGLGSIKKTGDIEYILARRTEIRRVISKTTITTREQVDRAWWQNSLGRMGLGHGQAVLLNDVPIKLDLPLTFTEEELRATVDAWGNHLEGTLSNWDDLGFVFAGESTPHWLGKAHARKTFQLDIQWIDEEQVQPAALLQQLHLRRAEVLAIG